MKFVFTSFFWAERLFFFFICTLTQMKLDVSGYLQLHLFSSIDPKSIYRASITPIYVFCAIPQTQKGYSPEDAIALRVGHQHTLFKYASCASSSIFLELLKAILGS